jgi:hypothetical protein
MKYERKNDVVIAFREELEHCNYCRKKMSIMHLRKSNVATVVQKVVSSSIFNGVANIGLEGNHQ